MSDLDLPVKLLQDALAICRRRVDQASFPQKLERGISPGGRSTPAFSDRSIKLGQVPARKMVRNVRRRKPPVSG